MATARQRATALLGLLSVFGSLAGVVFTIRAVRHNHLEAGLARMLSAGLQGAIYRDDTSTVLQRHNNDCGAAALMMILKDRGIKSDLADLERDMALRPEGVSLLNLRELAARRGAPGTSWMLSLDDLKHAPLPAILFVHGRHYVVVTRFVNPYVAEVRDPAIGKLYWPTMTLSLAWSGESLIFDPRWAPEGSPGKAQLRPE
jgi:ABC-type bacteriocin/lantibiotic exporter with double-glycine peptidase domain